MQTLSKPNPALLRPESLSSLLQQWRAASSATLANTPPASQRLGAWLGWAQAIELSQVLATPVGKASQPSVRVEASSWAKAELARVHAELTESFKAFPDVPFQDAQAAEKDALFKNLLAPYLQHFSLQERVIESRLSTLRGQLRARLSRASDALGRLALLDETMERALAAPQSRALTAMSALLEMRAHKHFSADPLHWRAHLNTDVERLLQAALDQKLQPVLGLIEALNTPTEPA